MSIYYSGAFTRSGGIIAAIAKQVKLINFKGVKRVTVKYDPFDETAIAARDYLHSISSTRIANTNANCAIKTEIICNRSNPTVEFQLIPSVQEAHKLKKITIDARNLTLLELLQVTNEHITARAPKEEVSSGIKTKSEKKAAVGKKR